MRRRAVSSLLLALGLVGSVQAQPGPQPKSQTPSGAIGAELAAVNACVRQVRQGVSQSRFEAHISPQGKIRASGTEEEMALFKRCMQSKGYSADLN
jgi:hypothetical protein